MTASLRFFLRGCPTLAALTCAAVLMAAPALAQTDAPPPLSGQAGTMSGPGGPHRGDPERHVEMLQRELDLSPAQVQQVKAMMATQHDQMEALHSNSSLSREQMHTQMMALHQEDDAKLRSLLTPAQITKYDAMQARMRDRMQEERGNGQTPPPPPSAQ